MDELPPLGVIESDALAKRRRARNIAMMVALVLVAVLLYAVAIVKLARPHVGAA